MPLIAWRLRNVAEDRSRVLMEGIHTCANCHSFSADGKTMGMDIDGPQNDKGLYAILPVRRQMAIGKEDVVEWSTFPRQARREAESRFHVAGLAGRAIMWYYHQDPGEGQSDYARRKLPADLLSNYYVANFKDYRFLQVFYPTRGILAWYSRETGRCSRCPAPTIRATCRPTRCGVPTASTWCLRGRKRGTPIRRA